MERGEIRLHARDTTEPSPFSHEVLNAKPYAFLDDAPLEERRTRALSLRRTLPEHQRDLGALDAEAIARVVAEAKPEPRDAEELHDALLGLVVAPVEERWEAWLAELVGAGRAARVGELAFAMENARAVDVLYFGAPRRTLPPHVKGAVPTRDEALLAVVRGHAEVCGPFTGAALAAVLGLAAWEVEAAIRPTLGGEGVVLRGRFTPGGTDEEVCDRRLLARIHRQTLDRLRSEIEPVSAQDFLRAHRLDAAARRSASADAPVGAPGPLPWDDRCRRSPAASAAAARRGGPRTSRARAAASSASASSPRSTARVLHRERQLCAGSRAAHHHRHTTRPRRRGTRPRHSGRRCLHWLLAARVKNAYGIRVEHASWVTDDAQWSRHTRSISRSSADSASLSLERSSRRLPLAEYPGIPMGPPSDEPLNSASLSTLRYMNTSTEDGGTSV